jgi:arginine-tRNA-protein transferase
MDKLVFYQSRPHPCLYLPGLEATVLVADPDHPMDLGLYSLLCERGFRRSGEQVYRPLCHGCDRCVPTRVRAATFRPRRSQRRATAMNLDLDIGVETPPMTDEDYDLFLCYQAGRHAGGTMERLSRRQTAEFLASGWSGTRFARFRLAGRLIAFAALDPLDDGLSAVYTFFDPAFERRSLGVYTILWAIQHARSLDLAWIYLGYWIRECAKMSYKDQYRPQQRLRGAVWVSGDWVHASQGQHQHGAGLAHDDDG